MENNQLAFDVAEREFGIPPVITGKEMASAQGPDKLSMAMYLSRFYELFRGTPLRPVGKDLPLGEPSLPGACAWLLFILLSSVMGLTHAFPLTLRPKRGRAPTQTHV